MDFLNTLTQRISFNQKQTFSFLFRNNASNLPLVVVVLKTSVLSTELQIYLLKMLLHSGVNLKRKTFRGSCTFSGFILFSVY